MIKYKNFDACVINPAILAACGSVLHIKPSYDYDLFRAKITNNGQFNEKELLAIYDEENGYRLCTITKNKLKLALSKINKESWGGQLMAKKNY